MRASLRCYPSDFRETLGPDMLVAFERELDRRRELAVSREGWAGRVAVFRYGSSTVAATVWNALGERIRGAKRGRAGDQRRSGGDAMWKDELHQNLTLLIRQARRKPGLNILLIVTVALGIGATAGVFSVVRGVLLTPLPYPEPNRLVYLTSGGVASLPNLGDLGERLESLESVEGMFVPNTVNLTGVGDPVQLQRSWVSADFFRVVGLQPVVGRFLEPGDLETTRAVLSHRLWQTRFGADPSAVGRTVLLNETPHEVVGVAPPAMGSPFTADVWTSLSWGPGEGPRGIRGWRTVEPYGRLADGWTLEEARAEIVVEWARLRDEYPDANEGWEVGVQTVKEQVTGDDTAPLRLLFGAAVLFLLIACANLASLFLSRLEERRREFAVRSALGAARSRLLRQAWTEALGLALLGGLAGVALAAGGLQLGVARLGGGLSRPDQVTLDGGVLLFALFATLFTAAVVGGVTVAAWSTDAPASALARLGRSVAGRAGVLRRVMVVVQVAMGLVMVTGLGLLVRSFQNMQAIEVGVRTESVIVGSIGQLSRARYPDNESRSALFERLQERIAAVPGIDAVALSSYLPLGGCCSNQTFYSVGAPEMEVGTEVRRVTPGYFEVLGIPLLEGGALASVDADGPTSVVVSEVMARELFGEEPAVGREVATSTMEGPLRIVGVVGAVREYAPTRPAPAVLYFSSRQLAMSAGYLVVRSGLPISQAAPALRDALAEIDPLIPLDEVRPLDEVLAGHMADHRATTFLMMLLGALALGLGLIGVYGVMSHAVQGRRREIGVRLALGASREGAAAEILRGALVLVLPGLVLGLVGAYAARRLIESMLYEVSVLDPLVYGAVTVLFLSTALVAAAVPARRAALVDVMEILADE